jgi:hypothetical protein
MNEPDIWTPSALREYVDMRFDAAERAIDRAEAAATEQARTTRAVLGLGLTAATVVTSVLVIVANVLT